MSRPLSILVTAGNTMVPIDQVRAITNIFHGRTGTNIANYFAGQGNDVALLTSNPKLAQPSLENSGLSDSEIMVVKMLRRLKRPKKNSLKVLPYKTFNDLKTLMADQITSSHFDVVIHSAAVSDYQVTGVCVEKATGLERIDSSKKISSEFEKLYLEMSKTEKLVDLIRPEWGFKRILVKFKLQVGISDEELIKIATKSMEDSQADFIVANCLEWSRDYAYIISSDRVLCVTREKLPQELFAKIKERIA